MTTWEDWGINSIGSEANTLKSEIPHTVLAREETSYLLFA